MSKVSHPENIKELEQYYDTALSGLEIYELPLPIALIVSLAIFEESHCTTSQRIPERFSAEAAMAHYKGALEILIPSIFQQCELQESPQQSLTITDDLGSVVNDAFHFCERYSLVVHAYTLYHQEQYIGSLSGRVADFQYPSGITLGRSSLNRLLQMYHEQITINQPKLSSIIPPSISLSVPRWL